MTPHTRTISDLKDQLIWSVVRATNGRDVEARLGENTIKHIYSSDLTADCEDNDGTYSCISLTALTVEELDELLNQVQHA